MTVVSLTPSSADTITDVRRYGQEIEEYLLYLRKHAVAAKAGVTRATTIEKVVYRYVRYIERYYSAAPTARIAGYRLPPGHGLLPSHREAVEEIANCMAQLSNLLTQPMPWVALPNLNRTRWGIQANLHRIITWIDTGLRACATLKGERPAIAQAS